ncbi:MAG: protease PrsW [Blastocatellia bacterium]|jgi:RsiW-degrading membrane proteinase PrsW (M82 family)|nr:protease PrsW [Blastocatellia bacterium]
MTIVLATFACMVALFLGLLVLLLIGFETGPVGLIVGMIAATLPVPFYVLMTLWIDRYESEPLWMLATAFFWGALIAVFIAYVLNTAGSVVVAVTTHDVNAAKAFATVISAPIVEETAKALILFIFFFWKKDEFDGIVDGIVYASMVGLGFAMTENIQYYGIALRHETLTGTLILRGTLAPFSHPLFTSMTGIGLGWARQSSNGFIKLVAPPVGLLLAIIMHATWNGSGVLFGSIGFFVTYFIIMVPVFIATLMAIYFGLRREGNVVRQHLYPDYQSGNLTPQEYERLCSVRGRMGSSMKALTSGGFSSWRNRMRYNQAASELAFHRRRAASGFFANEQTAREREAEYLHILQDLSRRLQSPRR